MPENIGIVIKTEPNGTAQVLLLSLIHISEPTRQLTQSRMAEYD